MNIVKKAGCILINMKEKKIALVLRNGNYSFPKGHLEEMETIKDCAKRETIEETGHEVEILGEEISIIRYKSSGGEDVENHFFIGIDTGRTNKKIAEKDKEKTEWFEIDKVKERLAYQNLKDTWNGIKPKIEKIVNELTRIFEILNIHPEENIEPKLISLYYQAIPCWVGKKRGYQLISEIV